jgi:hypothetical protein
VPAPPATVQRILGRAPVSRYNLRCALSSQPGLGADATRPGQSASTQYISEADVLDPLAIERHS